MTRTVKLSNGEATLKTTVNHSTKSAHEAALFRGVKLSIKPGQIEQEMNVLELPFENTLAADEALILGLLTKLVINEKELEINKQTLDEIDSADYDLLKKEANDILKPAGKTETVEKKSKS